MTIFHKIFRFFKKFFPKSVAIMLRKFFTATLTPFYFSYRNGHFISSLKAASFDKNKNPLPWYTYPMIDFLKTRDYSDRKILEFGGGQSSMWWGKRAKEVVTLEDNKGWYQQVKNSSPKNVKPFLVLGKRRERVVGEVKDLLNSKTSGKFDIVIIDGLFRREMVGIAVDFVSGDGAIICDNSEGYGFYDEFLNRGFQRIDFFGHAPGVILPHCTSLFFKNKCFLLDSKWKIPNNK